jgi:hypothetical protein
MWVWTFVLMSSLGAGVYFGSEHFLELNKLINDPLTPFFSVVINALLSFMSIGAPVWIGWLATKQIGQRFRLSEDYAFKASISRAYEGYRKEAARIDEKLEESHLEARLLDSALSRLDEQPLRLVETTAHGSPWHELLESDVVRDAIKSIPGFANNIVKQARDAVGKAKTETPAAQKAVADGT